LPNPKSWRFSSLFLKSFYCFTSYILAFGKFWIHCLWCKITFTFLHVDIQFSQTHWDFGKIELNLWITLGSIDILTVLIFPVHEYRYLSLYLSLQIFSVMFYSFHCKSLLPLLLSLFLFYSGAIINGIFFLISFSDYS
jgi:hypothetical protein